MRSKLAREAPPGKAKARPAMHVSNILTTYTLKSRWNKQHRKEKERQKGKESRSPLERGRSRSEKHQTRSRMYENEDFFGGYESKNTHRPAKKQDHLGKAKRSNSTGGEFFFFSW